MNEIPAKESNACRLKRTVLIVIAAAHWSFNISKQMAPVTDETNCKSKTFNNNI
jgi:hypothetical protein